jgi:hypothetical protein
MVIVAMAVGLASMFVGGTTVAGDPPAMQVDEFEFSIDNVYVPCLGEMYTAHERVTVRSHQFRTPTGVYHLVDQMQLELTLQGPGGTYFGIAMAPLVRNGKVGQASVQQSLVRAALKPIDHDGTVLLAQTEYKLTFDANERLVVLRDSMGTEDWVRCVRPGQ